MVWLLICILLNGGVFAILRAVGLRHLPMLPVLVVNYGVCSVFAWVVAGGRVPPGGDWLWLGLVQGLMFISVFRLTGESARQMGLGTTAVLTKLSVVLPLLVSLVVFGERLTPTQWMGLLVALGALLLLLRQEKSAQLPIVPGLALAVFIGSGLVDTNFKLFDGWFAGQASPEAFLQVVFPVAAVVGGAALLATRKQADVQPPSNRSKTSDVVLAGVVLGLVNYGSVLTILFALRELPGAVFYPLNNIGQLVLAGLLGVVLFQERPTRRAWLAYGLAVVAVILLM